MIKTLEKSNDNYFKRLIKLVIPILLQYLVISSLNLVDNVMIGKLGEISISGVGLGNQIYFLTSLFMFGVTGGASIFFAQYWGSKEIDNIHKTMGISMILVFVIASLFASVSIIAPKFVIGIYSRDTLVINEGARYLKIAAFSYIPFALSVTIVSALRATGHVKLPLFVSIIALGINTLLNYSLIFGNFGMPQLGVQGAAIATVIARTIEAALLIAIAIVKKYPIITRIRNYFSFTSSFFKKIIGKISVVLLNEGVWAIGASAYSAIYARMGTKVLTSMNISFVIFNLAFIIAIGVGNAIGIMIGNSLGASDFKRAKSDAKKGIITSFVAGLIIAILVFFVRDGVLSFYNVSPEVIEQSQIIIIAMLAMLPINCMGFTLFIGILRAGGDIIFCTIVDICAVWIIGLPLAYLGAFVFGLPVVFVFLLARMESVARVIVCFIRYRSFKWVRNLAIE